MVYPGFLAATPRLWPSNGDMLWHQGWIRQLAAGAPAPGGVYAGEPIEIKAGDTVWFPRNTSGVWEIKEDVRKVYVVIDRPNALRRFRNWMRSLLDPHAAKKHAVQVVVQPPSGARPEQQRPPTTVITMTLGDMLQRHAGQAAVATAIISEAGGQRSGCGVTAVGTMAADRTNRYA